MSECHIHIERFTPAEVASITGISTELQRDHRRRFPKWFAQSPGHARFNLFECLQMRFVSEARGFGLDVDQAYESGEWVAHSALYYALLMDGCISGDLATRYTAPDPNPRDIVDYTARRVFVEGFGRPRANENLIAMFWPDGADWFGPSVDDFLDNTPDDDPRVGHPFLAINTSDFAMVTVKLLPRPAARIFAGEDREAVSA